MRQPQLDFLHPVRQRPKWAWGLLASGVLLSAIACGHAAHLVSVNRALEAEAEVSASQGLGAGGAPADRASTESPAALQEVQHANTVLAALNVPWDPLFADLEAAGRPGIVLTQLQPDGDGRRLRIGGEASGFAVLTGYMEALGRRPTMANVLLTRHERAGRGVRFTLTADWAGRP